jgi:chromate transport protein ChrA
MINLLRRTRLEHYWLRYAAIAVVLLGAAILGSRPSPLWIGLIIGIGVAVILLKKPVLGLFLLIVVALLGPISISTRH